MPGAQESSCSRGYFWPFTSHLPKGLSRVALTTWPAPPRSNSMVRGKEAIRSLYESVFDEYTVQGDGELLEVEVAGDWAFYRTTYTLTATPKAGGEPIEDHGKCVVIVRREPDGSWKIARLIANSDQPPPQSR